MLKFAKFTLLLTLLKLISLPVFPKILSNINEIISFVINYKHSLQSLVLRTNELKKSNENINGQKKNIGFLKSMFHICSNIRVNINNLMNVMDGYVDAVAESNNDVINMNYNNGNFRLIK